jgi:hypothetical protein
VVQINESGTRGILSDLHSPRKSYLLMPVIFILIVATTGAYAATPRPGAPQINA